MSELRGAVELDGFQNADDKVKPFVVVMAEVMTGTNGPGGNSGMQRRALLHELDSHFEGVSRPRLVLDCSGLEHVGPSEIRLLIECLERAMTRNGDAKLAAVSSRVKGILSRTGVDRLFIIYDSREEAIRSFLSFPEVTTDNDDLTTGSTWVPIERQSRYPSSIHR
jgi:anti-anti-sigma factor